MFFEIGFFCATSSTESSGDPRKVATVYAYFYAAVVLLCAIVLAALKATFVLLYRFLFGYSSIMLPGDNLAYLPPISTQIKQPSILSNKITIVLLTVACAFPCLRCGECWVKCWKQTFRPIWNKCWGQCW